MYDVFAYVLAQTKFGATFRKKSWNHRGYNNLSPIEITPVGQVLWQGYRVWDRSGECSPWGQSIFYPHGTHPTPRRMTRYWSFKFLSPLFEKWNPTGSFFACCHLWKICPKGQNFWKPVILREVQIKTGTSRSLFYISPFNNWSSTHINLNKNLASFCLIILPASAVTYEEKVFLYPVLAHSASLGKNNVFQL